MIDCEALKETSRGKRFDRLVALLIGAIAVLAAALVVVQTNESFAEARANAQTRRLAAELTTRIIATGSLANHALLGTQRALLVSMEGASRGMVALQTGDAVGQAIGEAQSNAGTRLGEIAAAMGALPGPTSPLDAYARDVLSTPNDQLFAILDEQIGWAVAAGVASDGSSRAVMGLSLVALAGVLAGLAAVVGSGRTGRALLFLAYASATGAIGLLVIASGVLPG